MTGVITPSPRGPGLASGVRVRCPECWLWCRTGVEAWYRARYGTLLGFVRRQAAVARVGEAQLDAEGVVQATFAQLCSDLSKVNNPAGWLYTVAARAVGRAAHEQRRLASAAVTEDLVNGGQGGVRWVSLSLPADPDTVLAVDEVFRVMGRLPYRRRVAVYLRRVAGWSNAEVAEFLGCAAPTAAVHAHRGATDIVTITNSNGCVVGSGSVIVGFAGQADAVRGDRRDDDLGWVWCSCWGGDPQWGIGGWSDEAGVYRLLGRHSTRPEVVMWNRWFDASGGAGAAEVDRPVGTGGRSGR